MMVMVMIMLWHSSNCVLTLADKVVIRVKTPCVYAERWNKTLIDWDEPVNREVSANAPLWHGTAPAVFRIV